MQKTGFTISIHLMLMLIRLSPVSVYLLPDFNTSHVNVNRQARSSTNTQRSISIHLMLMLIDLSIFEALQDSISIHLMLMLIPMILSLFQSRLNLSLHILSHFPKNYQLISLFLTMGLINLQSQVFTGLLEIFFINCLVNTCII